MSEQWWGLRCARVSRAAVDTEVERIAASLSSSAAVHVSYESEPELVASIAIDGQSCSCEEVAKRLGGLVWFNHGDSAQDFDMTSLYFDGQLVFEVVCCELLASDYVWVEPSLLVLAPTSIADLVAPDAWVRRLASERFGPSFARIAAPPPFAETRTVRGSGIADAGSDQPESDDIPF